MRSSCCQSVYRLIINFQKTELVLMELVMFIMVTKPYFNGTAHKSLPSICLDPYVSSIAATQRFG
jgi:hypothetical protein